MSDVVERFQSMTTAQLSDAVARLELPAKIAPYGIRPLVGGAKFAGPASPAVMDGGADRVLECIYRSAPGDVVVLDNGGRTDEACFGDLAAFEARSQRTAGVVIWGVHRDHRELEEIGVPLFSYGAYPLGMQRSRTPSDEPFARCHLGETTVARGDWVFADDDGVVVVSAGAIDEVMTSAEAIHAAEQAQVEAIEAGTSLREQLDFDRYVEAKKTDPTLTLGEHMKRIGRHF